jgi:hypothetical protein
MSTLVILEAQVKPGFSAESERMLDEQLSGTRSFHGCQGILGYWEGHGGSVTEFVNTGPGGSSAGSGDGSADPGGKLVLIEYWDSAEAYHKYVTWRTSTRDLPNFVDICDGPPVVRICDLIDV